MKNNINFQGKLSLNHYFEGWYFKHVSKDANHVLSFIPGIALDERKIAFIQVINGINGETNFIEYPIEAFTFDKRKFSIQIGESYFSENLVRLKIDEADLKIEGELHYTNLSGFSRSFLNPTVMGWYSYVPKMECKHGLLSMNHQIEGKLEYNNQSIDFTGGKGYVEKDYGRSFPESWLWLQCNHFEDTSASIMISIAKIPWLGSFFIGHLCLIKVGQQFFNLSKYTGSKIAVFKKDDEQVVIQIKHRKYLLNLKITPRVSGELLAPVKGKMNRYIKESIDSIVEIQLLSQSGQLIFTDTGKRAGLEIIDQIFNYF